MPNDQTAIDRRTFISGQWASADPVVRPSGGEIASSLVQAKPECLDTVEAAIAALPGCEIHARDAKGKLVVVIDAPSAGAIGSTLNTIALSQNVLSAALVFHAADAW